MVKLSRGVVVVLVVVAASALLHARPITRTTQAAGAQERVDTFYIIGMVNSEGHYRLPAGTTVADAIAIAGGVQRVG